MEYGLAAVVFCLFIGWKLIRRRLEEGPLSLSFLQKKEQPLVDIDKVFEGFVGNEGAIHLLKREIRYARESTDKMPSLGLFGPPSTGKTELARRIAGALNLPMLSFSKSTLSKEENFFNEVSKDIENASDGMLMANPMVIFIDEAHVLPGRIQDSLLTALENDDRCFRSAAGDINTHNIVFLIATTDAGKLRPAFRSRLFAINLEPYTIEEIVRILKWRIWNDDEINPAAKMIPDDALAHIAKAGRALPRRAIDLTKMIAKGIYLKDISPTLESIQKDMWATLGCDEDGLLDIDRVYLRYLSKHGKAGLSLLVSVLGIDKDNIVNVIEPYLLKNQLIERHRTGRVLTNKGFFFINEGGGE